MLRAWLLVIMVSVFSPRATVRESADAMRTRFGEIARDAALVVDRDDPIVGLTKAETSALILAVSWHESGWRVDVDRGETRGGGRDVCLMQLRGVTADAVHDRTVCFREGLKRLKGSWKLCADGPPAWRLSAYASGRCSAGHVESAAMLELWRRWLSAHPWPGEGSKAT